MVIACCVVGCSAGSADVSLGTNGRPQSPDAPTLPTAVDFVKGYSVGYQQAQSAGKPMLVFFTARWCDYCHQMRSEAFTDDRVVRVSERFVCILVDADDEPGVCEEFQVRGYPTVQFLSPRGVPLNRLSGKTPGDALVLQMQAALQATASRVGFEKKNLVR